MGYVQYECKELKPYKGYEVLKEWPVDDDGKRIGPYVYNVQDEDGYIGEEYDSIKAAHRFIDSLYSS